MLTPFRKLRFQLLLLVSFLVAPPSFGAVQRTFVASYGNDANVCSVASPCRSINTAVAQTLSPGEVIVLDSGGYGTVVISQSVSIVAPPGIYAGISVIGPGIGVHVTAGVVVLDNLTINGLGGTHGIVVTGGRAVHVRNCTIANLATYGIEVNYPVDELVVQDSVVRGTSGGAGIKLDAAMSVTLERVHVIGNSSGIYARAGANLTVAHSVISGNSAFGMSISGSDDFGPVPIFVTVDHSLISDNAGGGILPSGGLASLHLTQSTLTRNQVGVWAAAASINASHNLISHNAEDGLRAESGATVLASANTFSRNGGYGLNNISGTIYTMKGADGLPNNAGEQASPTAGSITPVSAF